MQPLSRGNRVRNWPKSLGNQSASVSRPPQTHPPPLFSLFLSPIGLYPAVGWGFGTSRITGVYPPSLLPGLWCELIIFFLLLLSNLLHWTHSSLQPGYFIPLLFSSLAAFSMEIYSWFVAGPWWYTSLNHLDQVETRSASWKASLGLIDSFL